MFLKHQDVKQKNWRMRKVKKLFVSSCMLLTVGLGVAVPTAFSQSNGVMVVKAAEVPATDLSRQASDSERVDESSLLQKENLSVDSFKLENLNGWEAENDTAGNLGKFKDPDSSGYQNILTSSGKNISVAVAPKGSGKMNIKVTKRSNFQGGYYVGGLRTQTPVLKLNDVYRYSFTTKKLSGNSSEFKTRVKPVESNNKLGKELVIRVDNKNVSTKHDWLPDISDGTHTVDFTGLDKKLSVAFRFSPRQTSNVVYEFSNINIKNISPASVPAIPSKVLEGTSVLSGTAISSGDTLEKRKSFDGDILRVYKDSKIIARTVIKGNKWDVKLSKPLIAGEKLDFEILHPRSQNVSKKISKQVEAKPFDPASYKEKVIAKLKPVYEATSEKITNDAWLDENAKDLQKQKLEEQYISGKVAISEAGTKQEAIDAAYNKYSSQTDPDSLPSQYKQGNKENEQEKGRQDLIQTRDLTLKAIQEDKWLTEQEKTTQKEEALKAFETGIESVNQTVSLEQLKQRLIVYKASEKDSEKKEYPESIPNQHIPGKEKEVKAAKQEELKKLHDTTLEKINQDKWLTPDQQAEQLKQAEVTFKKGQEAIKSAQTLTQLETDLADYVSENEGKGNSIPDKYKSGNKDDLVNKAEVKLKEAHEATKQAIEKDPWLSPEQKKAQKEKAKASLDEGLKALKAADSLEILKVTEEAFVDKEKNPDSIPNQHKAGTADQARKQALDSLDKEVQKELESIDNDNTLTTDEKAAAKKKVNDAYDVAKQTAMEANSYEDLTTIKDEFLSNLPHKQGTPLKDQQSDAIAELEKKQQEIEKAIEGDKTLPRDEKEKQIADSKERLKSDTQKVKDAKNADAIKKAFEEGKVNIPQAHIPGDLNKDKEKLLAELKQKADDTEKAIDVDKTLTEAEKETQRGNVDKEATKAKEELAKAKDADALDKAYGDGVTSIKNQHKSGDPIEARRGLHNKSIDEVAQATKDAITADTTLTEAEKETQRGNVDKEATKAKEELAKAKDADALDKAYGDGVTSIKNQHKSGKGLDVRKDEHKKALEAVAKRVTAEIEADPTLTPEVREQQKAEVQKELELATDKIAEAKDADEADKAYGDGVTAIENVHVIGKGIEARKDLAKKDLAEAVAKTKALIIEDKTLTDDQRKEQLSGVDTEYAKGIENIAAAKDAAGVDKAYSDGVRDILAQYKEGQNLDDRRNAAKEFLLKEADKVTKLIKDDPTLTHDQKVDQINKVEQAKLDAIKSVDDAQTADDINDALGKGIENINNQYQHGDGVDVRKATAKGDLEKEAAKVKALIAKDPTLTQADKDKQTAAVDAAKNTAIAAVDKATTADGVNQELGKGITAINKAYRPGEAVKARKGAAKADLEKEAAKVKALIAKDPTLTQADKDKQTAAVDAAKNTAIAAVDKATTAEGINQELGKGITAINKAYRPGEGVKARKEAAKADLEKEAAKVREAIANDPTLTKADKAKQTEAVAKALKAAIAAVDKATTAEGINQELGKGITAINKAYRPGEGVKARKEAAKANLEKVAKETKALISGDRYLSETEKAVQKQAVEQALAKALGQVEAAKTVEAVKLAENLGTVAIRSAYVAGLAKDTDQATAALNEAKQAAIEALKQAAAETLAKITTDAKLTEAQKAEQSENVSLALKTAIATVRSAQSIASVKEAKDKGITAIRAAYVPNKAVAKSSSANHLPKSGDANSIVLVGLGVMSLLLGMVLYSKKKESKD
ncbi:TPA: DUF1542 domain-containing protein [Streptococcus pyogenes]|nr:DUF1542 domain-containing protein [Streptococcus pyogenes]